MKNSLLILIILVFLMLGIVYFKTDDAPRYQAPINQDKNQAGADDSTAAISADLAEIDLGDIDAEFKVIDADLNSL